MIESGLTEYWKTHLWPPSHQCTSTYRNNREGPTSLQFRDIQSPFLVLAIGLNLALFVFIMELLFYHVAKLFLFTFYSK